MKRLLAAAAVVLAVAAWCFLSAPARAAGIVPGDVSAEAKWLLHIDLDALRDSKIGEHVRAHALESGRVKQELEKVHDELGIDVEKDVHGATLYGADFAQHSGVLILYAAADKEKVVRYLSDKPDFTASKTDNGIDLYTWQANAGAGNKKAVWAAFPKAGVGVLADSAEPVKAALAVIGGKGGLSSSSPLLGDAPKGTILRGALVGVAAQLPIQSPLAKQIDDIHLAIGESDGEDFVKIKVHATNGEAATQMKSLADGFAGMLRLQSDEKHPELQKLLKGLKISSEGKDVSIDWSEPSDELIKIGEQIREKAKQGRTE